MNPPLPPLCAFIDASPSPYHAVATVAAALAEDGFVEQHGDEPWRSVPEAGWTATGGTLVAWRLPDRWEPADGFRIVGAHTDSPNLRVKPRPDTGVAGYRQLGVEVYGGVLLNSWLDRDLGMSGRAAVRTEAGHETIRFRLDRPLLRIPQLAIHLDRDVNDKGLRLDKQRHLSPLWGLGPPLEGQFAAVIAKELGVRADAVVGWDAMTHDLTPSTTLGVDGDLLSAPRIDNLASCWAGLEALRRAEASPGAVLCLYDHEEVGSQSATGAGGPVLATALERLALARGADRDGLLAARAASWCASADGAHATHPNYRERHEPAHPIAIGAGPVVKHNANERYATDADSAAWFREAAERAGRPLQDFVSRSDLPCGSTIGPVTAARLGIRTVDVGIPQLAMHSARELCGADDPEALAAVLAECLRT